MNERQHMTRRAQAPKGINRPRWAPNGIRELMKFNEKGQLVEPPHTVARFSRFVGMLSQEPSYFPINIVDWRHFNKASNMDRAWQRIKGTLNWTHAITLELEPKIRRVCEMKLNDGWKKYKANLKKAYYTPCLHSPLAKRFHCHYGCVNQGQWKLLVQLWDIVDAQEQVNGSKSNCITLFKLTHTRKNGEPVDARSAVIIDDFNTNMKLYEDRNEIITDEVRHIVYTDVLGPEKNNRVKGFGTGVVWSDMPGIIIEKKRNL
ncbi:hypothetical protein C1H46_043669 [Malus baccata]|uniref:Uncharacterized protein n=1 Tax=Malus baccata TaxID=106549 RepID=A0A540K988_MALBA|nr:hypothetical protein C1H46_043669 [Malus baccata]